MRESIAGLARAPSAGSCGAGPTRGGSPISTKSLRLAVARRGRQERRADMAEARKPNILVIWGDDIGITNLSCYSHGLMGYRTPNIDRIAAEGMRFTDYYGEQSCTAGRAAFIMGQCGLRT